MSVQDMALSPTMDTTLLYTEMPSVTYEFPTLTRNKTLIRVVTT